MQTTYFFVYGTLLESAGHSMHEVLSAHATHYAAGSIQARLYLISEIDAQGPNSYPGAVPSALAADRVHGATYDVHDPETLFAAFDEYEACTPNWPKPYEFLLRPVEVLLETGEVLWAKAYLYTWDTSRARLIPSGRFTERLPDAR